MVAGAGADTPHGLGRARGAGRATSRARCAARPSALARASPGPPAVRRLSAPGRAWLRETPLYEHDADARRRRPILRQYAYEPGPARGPRRHHGWCSSPRSRRGPPQPLESSPILAEPAAVCRGLAERLDPARGVPPPGPLPSVRRPIPRPRASRSSTRPRPRRARRASAGRCDSRRGEYLGPPRAQRAAIGAPVPLGFSEPRWAAWASLPVPGHHRPAHGTARTADRLAVVGDGSSLYQIQALWSAARATASGPLFVVHGQRPLHRSWTSSPRTPARAHPP